MPDRNWPELLRSAANNLTSWRSVYACHALRYAIMDADGPVHYAHASAQFDAANAEANAFLQPHLWAAGINTQGSWAGDIRKALRCDVADVLQFKADWLRALADRLEAFYA